MLGLICREKHVRWKQKWKGGAEHSQKGDGTESQLAQSFYSTQLHNEHRILAIPTHIMNTII